MQKLLMRAVERFTTTPYPTVDFSRQPRDKKKRPRYSDEDDDDEDSNDEDGREDSHSTAIGRYIANYLGVKIRDLTRMVEERRCTLASKKTWKEPWLWSSFSLERQWNLLRALMGNLAHCYLVSKPAWRKSMGALAGQYRVWWSSSSRSVACFYCSLSCRPVRQKGRN